MTTDSKNLPSRPPTSPNARSGRTLFRPAILCGLVGSACAIAASFTGCRASTENTQPAPAPAGAAPADAEPQAAPSVAAIPAPGESTRVGGDLAAKISGRDGDYRSGPCRIDTPLPAGYPPPTPPGAIDLKTYPSVRIAEVAGAGNPDAGMNRTFWPLFNHIKKHDIAMTSPVEMYYTGLGDEKTKDEPTSWSMAFLYRTPELNATGQDGSVVVRDADPVTVLAVGIKGDYSMTLVERGITQIEDWLETHPGWKPAGNWRSLYYNGPALMYWNKWAEVQLPIRRADAPDAVATAAPEPAR